MADGLPSALGGSPMGSAPMAVPTGNPGQAASGLSQVREAIKILEKALPGFGQGSQHYSTLLSAMQSLNKMVPPSAEVPGLQATTAQGLMQDANKNAAMAALKSAGSPAGAGAGAPPGGGPSPMAGAASAMPPSLAAAA